METENNSTYKKARKFVYLVVCSLLGVLLFLLLQQILVQGLALAGVSSDLLDSVSTIVALGLGAWYGVWLGSYWYAKVYAPGSGGFFYHVKQKFSERASVQEDSGWQMDDLVKVSVNPSPAPVVTSRPTRAKKPPVARKTSTPPRKRAPAKKVV